MIVETTIPTRLEELYAEYGEQVERIPASWEEFLDWLEAVEFPIEYDGENIIIMSYATRPHEVIIVNIGILLGLLFDNDDDILLVSSNHPVYAIGWGEQSYNADFHLIKGDPIDYQYRPGLYATLNPTVIFEILSSSTKNKDLFEKLPLYKKMPSLKQIVLMEQTHPFVTVYTRIGDSHRWENIDYDHLEQSFEVLGKQVLLKKLYKKVAFNRHK